MKQGKDSGGQCRESNDHKVLRQDKDTGERGSNSLPQMLTDPQLAKRGIKSSASTRGRLEPHRRAMEDRTEVRGQTQCSAVREPTENIWLCSNVSELTMHREAGGGDVVVFPPVQRKSQRLI